MKKNKIKIVSFIFSFILTLFPVFVFAQLENPLTAGNDIPSVVKSFMSIIVKLGGVVATFTFIWAGFLYVKAQGNEKELATAKEVFINTCIGVAILLGANLIATAISNTIGNITGK